MRKTGRCGPRALFEPVAADAHGMPCPNITLPRSWSVGISNSCLKPEKWWGNSNIRAYRTCLLVLGLQGGKSKKCLCVWKNRQGERKKRGVGEGRQGENMRICVCCVLIVGCRVSGEVVGCGRNYMMDREGDIEEPLS